jgi:Protein of unknown function (DUF2946)
MRKRRLRLAFTCFAVLLLLAQLAQTAGHLHAAGAPGAVAIQAAAGGADHPSKHPIDDDDRHCALCWAQAAAGSLLVPPVLALLPPAAIPAEPLAFVSRHWADRAAPAAFRPRAPPPFTA